MAPQRLVIWGSGSGPAWRVLIALEEKQLEYESKMIEFSKGGHKAPEVLALNPRGQVPVFKDGDVVVNESLASVQYIDFTYTNNPLTPKEGKPLALVLQRFHEVSNLATKGSEVMRPKMMGLIKTPDDEASWSAKVDALKTELKYWEEYLSGSKYVAGDNFTIADISLAPFVLSLERWGAEFKDFPNLKKYADLVKARSSVAKTYPPHWKDTPGQELLKGYV